MDFTHTNIPHNRVKLNFLSLRANSFDIFTFPKIDRSRLSKWLIFCVLTRNTSISRVQDLTFQASCCTIEHEIISRIFRTKMSFRRNMRRCDGCFVPSHAYFINFDLFADSTLLAGRAYLCISRQFGLAHQVTNPDITAKNCHL